MLTTLWTAPQLVATAPALALTLAAAAWVAGYRAGRRGAPHHPVGLVPLAVAFGYAALLHHLDPSAGGLAAAAVALAASVLVGAGFNRGAAAREQDPAAW